MPKVGEWWKPVPGNGSSGRLRQAVSSGGIKPMTFRGVICGLSAFSGNSLLACRSFPGVCYRSVHLFRELISARWYSPAVVMGSMAFSRNGWRCNGLWGEGLSGRRYLLRGVTGPVENRPAPSSNVQGRKREATSSGNRESARRKRRGGLECCSMPRRGSNLYVFPHSVGALSVFFGTLQGRGNVPAFPRVTSGPSVA